MPEQHAADDGANIEEARGHRRHAEYALGIEHSHDQAASDTIRMKGNMMRVSVTVSAALAGSNPGARVATSCGENTIRARRSRSGDRCQGCHLVGQPPGRGVAAARDGLAERRHEGGRQRAFANRSRSRLGMRNAAVNASMAPPPPNSAAQICSRARPSNRLHMTATPMSPRPGVEPFRAAVDLQRRADRHVAAGRLSGFRLSDGGFDPDALMPCHTARRARIRALTSSNDTIAQRMVSTAIAASPQPPRSGKRPAAHGCQNPRR